MMLGEVGDYEVVKSIGSGVYSVCEKIRRKRDGKVLAWKKIDYGLVKDAGLQTLRARAASLRRFRHPNVARYRGLIVDRRSAVVYIVMGYCRGQSLAALIRKHRHLNKRLEEEFVWKVLGQLALALRECHEPDDSVVVVHENLKPSNVFVDARGKVILGDFRFPAPLVCRTESDDDVYRPLRSFHYVAPEQLECFRCTPKTDVWSLGCLVYELCCLIPPFTATDGAQLTVRFEAGPSATFPPSYSSRLKKLVHWMLTVEEHARPPISMLLRHPVMKEFQAMWNLYLNNESNINQTGKENAMQVQSVPCTMIVRPNRQRIMFIKGCTAAAASISTERQGESTKTLMHSCLSKSKGECSINHVKKHVRFQLPNGISSNPSLPGKASVTFRM